MQERAENLTQRVDSLEDRVTVVEKGFPDGDVDGHARYHKMVMEEFLERRRIRQAIVEQVVKGSVWALLIAGVTASWHYFKHLVRLQ